MAIDNPDQLAGFLVPYPWSVDQAADHNVGTDYSEADAVVGRTTNDGTTRRRMALVASGDPDVSVLTDRVLQMQVVRAGPAGPGGGGLKFRTTTAGSWYGADSPVKFTGYQPAWALSVTETGSAPHIHVHEGVVYACQGIVFGFIGGYFGSVEVYARSSAGAWSQVGTATPSGTYQDGDKVGSALCTGVDGALWLYMSAASDVSASQSMVIVAFRSENGGVTWTQQAIVWTMPTAATIDRIRAAVLGGVVALMVTTTTGTIYYLASTDGGCSFAQLDSGTSGVGWDLRASGGFLYVLTGGANDINLRRLGNANTPAFDVAISKTWTTTATAEQGATIAVGDAGELWVIYPGSTARTIGLARSQDFGETWDSGIDGTSSRIPGFRMEPTTAGPYEPSAVMLGSRAIVLTSAWETTTRDASDIYELRFGGPSTVTLTQEYYGTASAARYGESWAPITTPTLAGWTIADTGAPTRTLTSSYLTLTTAGGEATSTATPDADFAGSGTMIGHAVIQVVSGSASVWVRAATYQVRVDVTSTGIRHYEVGAAAPGYTNHNIGGMVEVLVVINGGEKKSTCWFRAYDEAELRAYTLRSTITGLTTDGAATKCRLTLITDASSEVRTRWLDGVQHYDRQASALSGGVVNLAPVRLATSPAYVVAGVSVRAVGGLAVVDGTTYEVSVTSTYPKDAMLPTVQPSPRYGWRSDPSAAGDEILRFTPGDGATAQVLGRGNLWGLYLDGLSGIQVLDVDLGGSLGTSAVNLYFQATDCNVSEPDASGRALLYADQNTGPWLERDELRGGEAVSNSAPIVTRRIVGNTSGKLGVKALDGEAAVIELEGCDGTEPQGEWYIVPPRALLLIYAGNTPETDQIVLTIDAASNEKGADGDRRIGLLALGPVAVFGRPPDRTAPLEVTSGYELIELADGQRSTWQARPARRRTELAWVDSPQDVRELRQGSATSALLERTITQASADGTNAVTDRYGSPLDVPGLVSRWGPSMPLVWLPSIPIRSSTSVAVVAHLWQRARGALYGRIVSSSRNTIVPAGLVQGTDMQRLDAIVVEEEL